MNRLLLLPALLLPVGAAVALVNTHDRATASESAVARGKYIVSSFGCTDCHTPLHMTPQGPKPDLSRHLSGHPESLVMPPAPKLPEGPWQITVGGTLTAWNGPWGTSFTANLTPDDETGIGRWTEEQFVQAIRTGRHMGLGRPILPPMPWEVIRNLTDDDLKAVFAYLKSLPPIKNRVPEPIPPATPAVQ